MTDVFAPRAAGKKAFITATELRIDGGASAV